MLSNRGIAVLRSWAVALLATCWASACAAQYLPNVSNTPRAPVDVPQTNLTPIQPWTGGFTNPGYTPPPYTAPLSTGTSNPSVYAGPSSYANPSGFGSTSGQTGWSGTPMTSAPAYTTPPPNSSLGSTLFDPYSTANNAGTYAPAIPGAAPINQPAYPGWLPSNSGFGNAPVFGAGNPGFSTTPYGGAGQYPSSIYPSGSPNTLFPGGLLGSGSLFTGSSNVYTATRRFQGPRLRYGWLNDGDNIDDVEMNDIDTSLVFAFPNFLYTGQPLYVVPSFGLHLISGPSSASGADLPPQLYDAFLDTGWQSDPNQLIGADLGVRVGVFSDFDHVTTESVRVLGKGLATFRLTPYTTLKAGVYYLDRNDLKVLPAGGLLYQPTPNTRYDIFFPQPKLAQYFATVGTQDLWGYISGEYGGGSWTIRRANGSSDSIDINDIRVILGVEWGQNDLIRMGRHTVSLKWVMCLIARSSTRTTPTTIFRRAIPS